MYIVSLSPQWAIAELLLHCNSILTLKSLPATLGVADRDLKMVCWIGSSPAAGLHPEAKTKSVGRDDDMVAEDFACRFQ